MEFLHFGSLIPQLYEIVAKFLKYKIPLALIHFNYTTVVYVQLLCSHGPLLRAKPYLHFYILFMFMYIHYTNTPSS